MDFIYTLNDISDLYGLVAILYALVLFLYLNLLVRKLKIKIDIIIFANVLLMFIALIEPAPSDVLFILLLLYAFKDKIFSMEKYLKMKLVLWFISSYVFVCTISMFTVKNYALGLRFLGITVYLIIYSMIIFFYSNEHNYLFVLKIYVIASTIAAILGIMGYMGFFSSYLTYDMYRVKSLFKDPNVFGSFLVPALIILFGDIHSRKLFSKINEKSFLDYKILLYIVLLAINATGLIISFSRGAWVSLIGSTLVLLALNFKKIGFKRFIAFLYIISFLLTIIWFGFISSEMKGFFLERASFKGYDIDRFTAQAVGLSSSLDHVFGYGPGQYETVVNKEIGIQISSHSLYTRVILENGIIGFFLLIIPSGYIIIKLFKLEKVGDERYQILSSILISILVALIINSIVIDTLHWRHLWLFYGLSMSLASNLPYKKDSKLELVGGESNEKD